MPNIIRHPDGVRDASMDDLNHTYRALRDEPKFPGFKSRAAAEVQTTMAIMASQDAVGRNGVPPGVVPGALTPHEMAKANPYKPGSMSHALHEAINNAEPLPQPAPAASGSRRNVSRVRATNAGTSRPLATSLRGQVLAYVQAAGECAVADIEQQFNQPVRGQLQKLIEKNHLEVIE